MPSADGILELSPSDLEKEIARLLDSSLGKRGAAVDHDGAPGKPDIVVDAGDFAFIVEVAKRSGASAASEHPAIREHREETERRLGKTTHLLFTCLATPGRLIREMAADNEQREAADDPARALFLDIEALDFLLGRLVSSSSDLYPLSRWHAWFRAWREVRDDTVALERATEIILAEDEEATTEVRRRANVRAQIEQEALRRDIQQLEDVLRHRNVVRDSAMHALVYIVFVKLYEEKREKPGVHSRFTTAGFERYRQSLPRRVRTDYKDRTLDYLLQEIALDEEVQAAGILEGVTLPPQIDDPLVTRSLLPVLDRYHFRGTHLDALGAVFEALARRAEKDTRIGQFFTPGPIVQMAVEMARPAPTELVLDPAVGTGRFLVASMERMLAHTAEVAGARPSEVAQAIRSTRLLGTDVDPWIVTIAKMNMYIHGDGKTNIRHQNGLFLADLAAFPEYPTLLGEVDLVLTNPPLGELNYRAYADEVTKKPSGRWDAATWLQERLPLLPGRFAEERIIENAEAKINEWEGRLALALRDGNHTEAEKARRWRRHHEEKRAAARVTLENGQAAYETSGVTAKGGALFLAAITHYLRPAADASKVEEWKGGRAAIIVDEAILNTPDYAETRRFLRRHFFIKAIVSFERDAFWYQARTTAKTSLLYIVKKPDPDVVQREPTFYCHIRDIGFTRTGQPSETEIPHAVAAYRHFETAMVYRAQLLDEDGVRSTLAQFEWPKSVHIRWLSGHEPAERLDYAYVAARAITASLPPDHRILGDYVESVVRNPEEAETRFYRFATIERNTGEVRSKELTRTKYSPTDLRVIREGDVVVSGIDLVNGAAGYADASVDGLVVSKEFYTLTIRADRSNDLDPRYLAVLVRTPTARSLMLPTGTSNRTRLEGVDALLALPVPILPPLDEQAALADRVHQALETRRTAAGTLETELTNADAAWASAID